MSHQKAPRLSAAVCNASMILYLVWLLLPAVQTTGRAAAGCLCVALFGFGVLLDLEYLKKQWMWMLARAACAAAMPLLLRVFLKRGGDHFAGFYVQQAMSGSRWCLRAMRASAATGACGSGSNGCCWARCA